MEQAAYLGNGGEEAARARWRPRRRGVSTHEGTVPVWPRVWLGRSGSSWRREVVGARGGVGTTDAREAVATTGVGRGGGGVLGVVGRVAWEQGERNQ